MQIFCSLDFSKIAKSIRSDAVVCWHGATWLHTKRATLRACHSAPATSISSSRRCAFQSSGSTLQGSPRPHSRIASRSDSGRRAPRLPQRRCRRTVRYCPHAARRSSPRRACRTMPDTGGPTLLVSSTRAKGARRQRSPRRCSSAITSYCKLTRPPPSNRRTPPRRQRRRQTL